MPIKIINVFAASDGATFPNEAEAKAHEVSALAKTEGDAEFQNALHKFMFKYGNQVLAILTDKPDALPKRRPRSDKGKQHAKRNNQPVAQPA